MVVSGGATNARIRSTGDRVRLVVLSDRRLFREALATSLGAETDCAVIGHAASIEDAVLLCRLCRPDTVLLDVGRGLRYGTMNRPGLTELATLTRVVAVYEVLSTAEAGMLRRAGVDTHVAMSGSLDGLLEHVRPTGPPAPTGSDRYVRPGALTGLEHRVLAQLGAGHTADSLARSLGISVAAVTNAKRRLYRKLNVSSQSQAVALVRALRIVAEPRLRSDPARWAPPGLTPREGDILRSIALGHTVRQTARYLGIATKTVENTQARLFFKLGARSRVTALAAALDRGLVESIGLVPAPEPPGGPV